MMSSGNISIIECKSIPQELKHSTVFNKFDSLKSGNTLQLITDHDPKTLFLELLAKNGGQFVWAYIDSGPEVWKINIKKI